MRVTISNTSAVERAQFFGKARLTYSLGLCIIFTDAELAAIAQKNLNTHCVYRPPWHPYFRIAENLHDHGPELTVKALVKIHHSGVVMGVGYFDNDHQAYNEEQILRKGLANFKLILDTDRVAFDEFEL